MRWIYMKNRWLALFILCSSIQTPLFSAEKKSSAEENLALRRIAEYWKEGDFSTVKSQIKSFLAKHPQTSYADSLHSMLGDLYFKEKNYAAALDAYDQIKAEPFLEKTQFNHLYCLYQQKLFDDVATFGTTFLNEGKKNKAQENAARFQLADSLFHLGKTENDRAIKENLYKQALAHFELLSKTDYADQALYPSAAIYSHLKEYAKAASLFKALSSKYPDQKEVFLFQAATLQLHVDKNAAIDTFGEIYLLNGPQAPKAAYNQIQLLYEQKRYRDLLLIQEKALNYIPVEHLNTVRYYIGKSLFALKDYSNAIVHLLQFTDQKPTDAPLLKNAYLSLVVCAKETQDMPLLDRSVNKLTASFPNEEETAQAILMRAQLCREKGELEQAQQDLQTLISQFPHHTDRETFLYEQALLFSLSHQWENSSEAFYSFLQNYPQSSNKNQAYRHLITSQIEIAKSASPETKKIKKEELADTLAISLKEDNLFSTDEKKQMHLLLGKTLFEVGQTEEALTALESYVDQFSNDLSSSEAHLLIAYCYAKDLANISLFAHHAEKALALGQTPSKNLRVQLYNAYLLMAKEASSDQKIQLVDQAANHLFLSGEIVKDANRQWLATHYFQRYQHCSSEEKEFYLKRAIVVLETLVGASNLTISEERLEMEAEAIKLSQLYVEANRPSDAIDLLCSLDKHYASHPDFDWKYRRLTLFELGKLYEQTGNHSEALHTYNSLISTSTHAHSYFGAAAKLKKSKLAYSLLTQEQKQGQEAGLQEIYDDLKDLQIQRRLVTEPWHLEAALTYIDIKTSLAPEEEKLNLEQRLISQTLAQFASKADPEVEHYLTAAGQFPEQFAVYQDYIQFLHIEKARLTALSEQKDKANAFHRIQAQYNSLLEQPLDDQLKQRVEHRINEIKALESSSSLMESGV